MYEDIKLDNDELTQEDLKMLDINRIESTMEIPEFTLKPLQIEEETKSLTV